MIKWQRRLPGRHLLSKLLLHSELGRLVIEPPAHTAPHHRSRSVINGKVRISLLHQLPRIPEHQAMNRQYSSQVKPDPRLEISNFVHASNFILICLRVSPKLGDSTSQQPLLTSSQGGHPLSLRNTVVIAFSSVYARNY